MDIQYPSQSKGSKIYRKKAVKQQNANITESSRER
jgi:hypothetical protein